ncbi:MAG TPA: M3 family metallopeptidase [Polyangiaceae bacterium]|nr:M3 family metallopeptidase [Polyangiaceae bacterium]
MTTPAPLDLDPTLVGQSAAGITDVCDASLARAARLVDEIRGAGAGPDEALTWARTFGAFDDVALALSTAGSFAGLLSVAHPDEAVREAARACEPKVDAFATALFLDAEVAAVLRRYAARGEALSPARARFVEHTLRDFRCNGLELDAGGQARLRELNEAITEVSLAFETNLASATLSLRLPPERLEGLPASYLEAHPPGPDGRVTVTTDYPDYFPFLQYARDRAAAFELYKLFDNRAAAENLPLLDRLLALRHEKARLLGYPTWAHYVLETRMAKEPGAVGRFLEGLRAHVAERAGRELAEFRALYERLGGGPGPIPPSDRLYLEDRLRQEKFGLDSREVSEYFEVGRVEAGLLAITARLYGVRYREAGVPVWHPDVRALEVLGAGGAPLGRVYLDLHPRPGKFKHAAVFGLRASKATDAGRLAPVAALVCNFPKPGGDAPALLNHGDVVTFFHEFGHVLHQLLTASELASFSGTRVARDFVEAPSQMFEEWAWSRETLDLFARHHRTGAPMPDRLFAALVRSRAFGRALATQRQLMLAALDQAYHTRPPGFDTTRVLAEIQNAYTAFPYVEGTHFQATFGHLVGYDAGYYGYQWALSLARDLYTRFEREGLLNAETAAAYREAVLAPGGSGDEAELVARFLGRPPSDAAYRAYLDAPA